MKTITAMLATCWISAGVVPAQQPERLIATLVPDSIGSGYDLLWAGEEDVTYFVMGSNDLVSWRFFDVIAQGDEEGHRFWFFNVSPRYFVRVLRAASPTYPWDDPDNDQLLTSFELKYSMVLGFSPFKPDSNDDRIADGEDDPDEDGLTNLIEQQLTLNPAVADSDVDGLPDRWEVLHELDPLDDGSTDPDSGPGGDPDNDGRTNAQELADETDPNVIDGAPASLLRLVVHTQLR